MAIQLTYQGTRLNEFSGVPVFQPEQQPAWQEIIDGCHPSLRTVALAGVSAVQASINEANTKEQLLSVAGTQQLLGDTPDLTSALLEYVEPAGYGREDPLRDSEQLIFGGICLTALAKRLSPFLNEEKGSFFVPVATATPLPTADPASTSTRYERRIHDMFSDRYFQPRPRHEIFDDYRVAAADIEVTDTHANSPAREPASTHLDVQVNFDAVPRHAWKLAGLFATLGVMISPEGLVYAKSEFGPYEERETSTQDVKDRRRTYKIQGFEDLQLLVHYFAEACGILNGF